MDYVKRRHGPFDDDVSLAYWDRVNPVKDIVSRFGFSNSASMLNVVRPLIRMCEQCSTPTPIYIRSEFNSSEWANPNFVCRRCKEAKRLDEVRKRVEERERLLQEELRYFLNKTRPLQYGTVKWYDASKGCGQIEPDVEGLHPHFVDCDEVEAAGIEDLAAGDRVEYVFSKRRCSWGARWQATRLRLIQRTTVEEEDHSPAESRSVPKVDEARLEALRGMPYRDYLLTDEWHRTRRTALFRSGNRCQICNSVGLIDVHHRGIMAQIPIAPSVG